MKKFQVFSVLALVSAVSGAAFAHGRGGGRMFQHLDTNNDGKVTLAEAQAGAQARFTRLDKNKDGVISGDELQGPRPMMKHADANGDGKVTLAELQAQTTGWFSKLDKNGDKVITKDELAAARGDHPCHRDHS